MKICARNVLRGVLVTCCVECS